jgi:CBS domain-containing protein
MTTQTQPGQPAPEPAASALLRVEQFMTPLVTVRDDAPLREVARQLEDHECVGVTDAHGRLIGMITASMLTSGECLLRLCGGDPTHRRALWFAPANLVELASAGAQTELARTFMDRNCTAVTVGDNLSAVVRRMLQDGSDYAVVYRGTAVVGAIARRDLLRVLADGETLTSPYLARIWTELDLGTLLSITSTPTPRRDRHPLIAAAMALLHVPQHTARGAHKPA